MFSRSINYAPLSPGESLFELAIIQPVGVVQLRTPGGNTISSPTPSRLPGPFACQLVKTPHKTQTSSIYRSIKFPSPLQAVSSRARLVALMISIEPHQSCYLVGQSRGGGGASRVNLRNLAQSLWGINMENWKATSGEASQKCGVLGDEKSVIVSVWCMNLSS